jgi:phage shock protein PspC (stress-responsive transcriptional regulator)
MTETTFMSPRLERPARAPLAGVSLALARTTGTDVVLWRVLFVVLTVFGGLGIALYLACYVAIPKEGVEHSLLSRLIHGPDRRVTTRQLLLLALVVVATAGALHDNGGAVVVAGLAGLGYLWWRRRHLDPPAVGTTGTTLDPAAGIATAAPVAPAPAAAAPTALLDAGTPVAPVDAPTWQPPAARPRSVVTSLALSAAALLVGALLLVAATGTASVPTEVVLASALGVVGLGLVASAFWGRARGLVPVALLLALALGGTVAARPALDHGVGERHWTATASGSYRLGIGDATLTVPASLEGGDVVARVSLGHLQVVVPPGVHVIVDARVKNGDVQGPGGVDENGRDAHHRFELGPTTAPAVHVDARVGAGMVEVRRG